MKDIAPHRYRMITRLGSDVMTESHLCRLQGVEGFEKEVVVKQRRPQRDHRHRRGQPPQLRIAQPDQPQGAGDLLPVLVGVLQRPQPDRQRVRRS